MTVCNGCQSRVNFNVVFFPAIDKGADLCHSCLASAFVALTECKTFDEAKEELARLFQKWGLK